MKKEADRGQLFRASVEGVPGEPHGWYPDDVVVAEGGHASPSRGGPVSSVGLRLLIRGKALNVVRASALVLRDDDAHGIRP